MRRDRIIEAVERVGQALSAAQVRDVISMLRSERSGDNGACVQKVLTSYGVFSQHHAAFGEEEKELISRFGLTPLVDVNFWSSLLEAEPSVADQAITDIDVGVYNVLFVVPKVAELIAHDNGLDARMLSSGDDPELKVKRLRIFIANRGMELTDTFVLINIIKAVEDLYEAMFLLHKTEHVAIKIGDMDSGTVKVIDFFGAEAVIDDLAKLVGAVWHWVKNSMDDNFRRQVEVALSGTGFDNRLKTAKRTKLLNDDEAQRISHTIAKSIETMFRNGAFTREMDEVSELRASDVLHRRADLIEYRAGSAQDSEDLDDFRKPRILEEDDSTSSVVPSVSKSRSN